MAIDAHGGRVLYRERMPVPVSMWRPWERWTGETGGAVRQIQTGRLQLYALMLIAAVAAEARRRGASRYYWQTRQDNARARALYDNVAVFRGFIRYDYSLD